MGGREHDHRHRRIAGFLFGDGDADGGMRIDETAGLAQQRADRGGGLLLVGAVGGEQAAQRRQRFARQREAARLRQRAHHRADRLVVAAAELEQDALEIRGDLDVHRRRRGRDHVAGLVGAGRERARQDVVDVGGDHQPVDRQAHAHGDVAGIDVAEISGRDGEGELAMRRAKRDRGGEVVDRLRDDARPVDRVDAGERDLVAEGMVIEQALHDRLAVVEGALDRERMDVVVLGRGHHAPLHVGDAAVRDTARRRRCGRGRGTPRPRRRRCRRRSPPPRWCARRARRARDPSAGPGAASPGP